MPLYDAVKDLTLTIESVELEPHVLPLKHITRRTTVVHLRGDGEEGVGEDVSYEEALQLAFTPDALPDLAGEHTLDSFSALVAGQPGYRQWGLESAALDLALRQAGRSLADAVGREPAPVTFVVSQSAVAGAARALPRDPLQARRERQVDGRGRRRARRDRRRRRRRLQGALRRRLGRGDTVGRAVRPRRRGVPAGVARGRAHRRRDAPRARAAPRTAHLGLSDPFGGRRRGARVAAALPELEAVALRQRQAALRLLRPLRRERDRGLRRRPVRARPGTRPDPAPRVALPPRDAERRRAEGVQRGRPEAGPAAEPARPRRRAGFARPRALGSSARICFRRFRSTPASRRRAACRGRSSSSDCSLALPRAPSASEIFATVAASGASTMLTKSYSPSVAHWCSTFAPSSSTSWLTSRSRLGFAFSVCTPCGVSVDSIR